MRIQLLTCIGKNRKIVHQDMSFDCRRCLETVVTTGTHIAAVSRCVDSYWLQRILEEYIGGFSLSRFNNK